MKQVIDGVAYNTRTSMAVAMKIVDLSQEGSNRQVQSTYCLSRNGMLFRHDIDAEIREGRLVEREEILPRDRDQALAELTPLTAWKYVDSELIEAIKTERVGEAVLTIRVPMMLKKALDQTAKSHGVSVNHLVMRALENTVGSAASAKTRIAEGLRSRNLNHGDPTGERAETAARAFDLARQVEVLPDTLIDALRGRLDL